MALAVAEEDLAAAAAALRVEGVVVAEARRPRGSSRCIHSRVHLDLSM